MVRIRREQIMCGYDRELRAVHVRVVALRRECEIKVERAKRKWERNWAIERGEIAVVVNNSRTVKGVRGRVTDDGGSRQHAVTRGTGTV